MFEIVAISGIKENPNNPRYITENKFAKLKKSIKDFPEMLNLRPLIVDEDFVVLGGNMRLRACKELGYTEVPVIRSDKMTEEQKKEFLIKDNLGFGEWDMDMLANEWDAGLLEDWGFEFPDLDEEPEKKKKYFVYIECENEDEQEKIYNETEPLYQKVKKK